MYITQHIIVVAFEHRLRSYCTFYFILVSLTFILKSLFHQPSLCSAEISLTVEKRSKSPPSSMTERGRRSVIKKNFFSMLLRTPRIDEKLCLIFLVQCFLVIVSLIIFILSTAMLLNADLSLSVAHESEPKTNK